MYLVCVHVLVMCVCAALSVCVCACALCICSPDLMPIALTVSVFIVFLSAPVTVFLASSSSLHFLYNVCHALASRVLSAREIQYLPDLSARSGPLSDQTGPILYVTNPVLYGALIADLIELTPDRERTIPDRIRTQPDL